MNRLPQMNTPHGLILQLGRRTLGRGHDRRRGGRGMKKRGTPTQTPKRTRDSTPNPPPMADMRSDNSCIGRSRRTRPPAANPAQRGPPGGREPPETETHHPPKRAHYLDVDECLQQELQDDQAGTNSTRRGATLCRAE